MATACDYQHIRVTGTKQGILVSFVDREIFKANVIQTISRELLSAADLAARIDMPMLLSFRGVEGISSALVGKLVLLKRKAKSIGIELRLKDVSPVVVDKVE